MNEHLWKCLVQRGKFLVERKSWKHLRNFVNIVPECGCNSPKNGEPECPCRMSQLLEDNLQEVIELVKKEYK